MDKNQAETLLMQISKFLELHGKDGSVVNYVQDEIDKINTDDSAAGYDDQMQELRHVREGQ